MSNFWTLSDGKAVEQTNNFDSGANEVLPDNTDVLAFVEEAGWDDGFPEGSPDVVRLRWNILRPEVFKGNKIWQKIKAKDLEAKTSDKAKRMLMAIDVNAGGKLAKLNHEPNDEDLMMALMNKPMVLKLKVWEINGKKGNWVAAVSPAKKAEAAPAPAPAPEPAMDDFDPDSIPF